MVHVTHGTERQYQFEERVRRVLELPVRGQAGCVLVAAEMSLPIWEAFEERSGVVGVADGYVANARAWLAGRVSDEEFEAASDLLRVALPEDLTKLNDPAAGMAGYALLDVMLIGLGQCEDVHTDILFTGVCYALAAASGECVSPSIGWNTLTDGQLDLADRWWAACCEGFPGLPAKALHHH